MLEELLDAKIHKEINTFINNGMSKNLLLDKIYLVINNFMKKHGLRPDTIYLGKKEIDVFDYLISDATSFWMVMDKNNKFKPERRFQNCKLIEVAEISHVSAAISIVFEDKKP